MTYTAIYHWECQARSLLSSAEDNEDAKARGESPAVTIIKIESVNLDSN